MSNDAAAGGRGLIGRHLNSNLPRKIIDKVIPGLPYLWGSRFRRCRACDHLSLFLAFSHKEERQVCIRCGANLRYEMLAEHIRQTRNLPDCAVLELDPESVVAPLLSQAKTYIRSYWRAEDVPGSTRADGARMEDITALTLADESLDLIVSSDVLEHVPDAHAAFRESARVLKSGGAHVFTVPFATQTRQCAKIESGRIVQIVEPPEYHSDPLDPKGILVFWEYGPDMGEVFADSGLIFSAAKGPEGGDRRIIWEARKP